MGVFKSYDIRGVYPTELDATMARKIGVGLGKHFSGLPENAGRGPLRLVVGRDMRTSAPEMTAAFIDGLLAAGHNVVDIGMVTTPCQYFAIQRLGADGGIMVTASHNPPQYIGFKVSRELAIPISKDTGLGDVEKILEEPAPEVAPGQKTEQNVDKEYLDFLVGMAHETKPIKIAVDASNGMAGKYIGALLERLGCPMEGIYLEPDGTFPNHEADPLKPENLRDLVALVQKSGAAIGFCYDGDADRVAIVDETGEMIGCDFITALLCTDSLKGNAGKAVTYDLRSSKVVKEVIEENRGKAVKSRVGHSHVKRLMRSIGAVSGGELSGHYYFQMQDRETFYADSALVATVRLINILSSTGKKVSELLAPMRRYYHTGEVNFQIDDKDAALAEIRSTFADAKIDDLDGVSIEYADWWCNVRPSNTEPLLRLTLEGNTPKLRDDSFAKVLGVLNKYGHQVKGGH